MKSVLRFCALLGTVGLAGVEPLLGMPAALALIYLSIQFEQTGNEATKRKRTTYPR